MSDLVGNPEDRFSLNEAHLNIKVDIKEVPMGKILALMSKTTSVWSIIFYLFFIQFNVPFKIISLIDMSQSVGGAKRE